MFADASTDVRCLSSGAVFRNSLHVGAVTVALCGSSPDEIRLGAELDSFVDNSRPADIEVSAEFVESLARYPGEATFNSGALWQVFRDKRGFVFDFTSDVLGAAPYKRLIASRDFSSARLLLNRSLLAPYAPIFPLEYPADELLITNYLASRRLGVEVHGCGLIDSVAGGQLFLGHSGAGKSTTTRIWQSSRNPTILSDDRIILRLEHDQLRMFGTPWHGEAAFAEQGKSALQRIFILRHGEHNYIKGMPKAQAVGEVFARSFPPFHSAEGLDGTIDFINRVLDVVPCYEFQFVPDQSAVEAVLGFNG